MATSLDPVIAPTTSTKIAALVAAGNVTVNQINALTTKGQVGLSDAENTTDLAKPISTATQNALDLKAPLAAPALTGAATLDGVAISTVTQASVDAKAPLIAPALTGAATLDGSAIATAGDLTAKANLAAPAFTGVVTAESVVLAGAALTSSAAIAWDASDNSQPTLALAHDTTITLSNLADRQSVSLSGTMAGSGGHTVVIAMAGLTARVMGGALTDISALVVGDLFEISIKREGTNLRISILMLAL